MDTLLLSQYHRTVYVLGHKHYQTVSSQRILLHSFSLHSLHSEPTSRCVMVALIRLMKHSAMSFKLYFQRDNKRLTVKKNTFVLLVAAQRNADMVISWVVTVNGSSVCLDKGDKP